MGVYKFSTGKIEIENSDMDWFVVPKSVSFSYNNTKSTNQSSKLYFFIDGKAEISISNQSNTDLLFSGTSENVKLKLSNPNVGSISVVGNYLEIVDKYNKLKSELSKVKSLILLNNDNELQDLLFVKLLLNKEITNTKKQIDEYEDAIDY